MSIGKQLLDFLFKDVRLLGTFDIDNTLPVVTPPPPLRSDGIMLKPNILFDRFIVVTFKGQQDDSAAPCQRNRGRYSLGELEQNGALSFGHSDLGCLPWHGDTFGEDGRKEKFPSNSLFKQDQFVLAALARWNVEASDCGVGDKGGVLRCAISQIGNLCIYCWLSCFGADIK